jgi:hypothetical protein
MMDDEYSKYRIGFMNAHEGFAFHHRSMISPTLPENNIEVPIPMATRAYVGEDPPNSGLPLLFPFTPEEERRVFQKADNFHIFEMNENKYNNGNKKGEDNGTTAETAICLSSDTEDSDSSDDEYVCPEDDVSQIHISSSDDESDHEGQQETNPFTFDVTEPQPTDDEEENNKQDIFI